MCWELIAGSRQHKETRVSVSKSADCLYRMGHNQSTNRYYHVFPFQLDKKSLTKLSGASRSPRSYYSNLPICEWVREVCAPVVRTLMKYRKDHGRDWQDDSVNIRAWTSTSSIYWWNIDHHSIWMFSHVQQIPYQIWDELVLQVNLLESNKVAPWDSICTFFSNRVNHCETTEMLPQYFKQIPQKSTE